MQFQQIDRSDAEKVYAAVYNVSGATQSAGNALYYIVASGDGISVSNAGTTRQWAFAGIAKDAIADSAYGRVQVYGQCSAYVVLSDTGVSGVPGDQLDAVNSQAYLQTFSAPDHFTLANIASSAGVLTWNGGNPWNHAVLMGYYSAAASANSTVQLTSIFVRAL